MSCPHIPKETKKCPYDYQKCSILAQYLKDCPKSDGCPFKDHKSCPFLTKAHQNCPYLKTHFKDDEEKIN